VQATLTRISTLAVQTIDGFDHAGISLIQGRKISWVAIGLPLGARRAQRLYRQDD
jgi:hypothetical protein